METFPNKKDEVLSSCEIPCCFHIFSDMELSSRARAFAIFREDYLNIFCGLD